ncbi:hypothetical protein KCU92_g55, partial [Aureobasidium melanogenum]
MYSISREPNHNLLVSSVVLIIVGSFLSVRGQCSNSGGRLRLVQHSWAGDLRWTFRNSLDSALPSDDAGTTSDDRELTMPVMPASLVPRERVHARQHDSSHHALLFLLTTTPLLLTASFFVQSQFTFAEHLLAKACWDARLIAWRQGLWSQVTPVMVTNVGRQVKSESIERWLSIRTTCRVAETIEATCSLEVRSLEIVFCCRFVWRRVFPLDEVWSTRRRSVITSGCNVITIVGQKLVITISIRLLRHIFAFHLQIRLFLNSHRYLEAVEKSRLIVAVLLADSGAVPLEGLHLLHHPYLASNCLQQSLSVGQARSLWKETMDGSRRRVPGLKGPVFFMVKAVNMANNIGRWVTLIMVLLNLTNFRNGIT